MPANVAGQNLARTGKAARRAFVQYKERLSPGLRPYAEAYWRHKRREQVEPPKPEDYRISRDQGSGIEGAIDAIIAVRGAVVEKRAGR